MSRWPWIATILAVLACLHPLADDLYRSAFLSGEQLSRSIGQFMLLVAVLVALTAGLLEWGIRVMIVRRRARKAGPPAA